MTPQPVIDFTLELIAKSRNPNAELACANREMPDVPWNDRYDTYLAARPTPSYERSMNDMCRLYQDQLRGMMNQRNPLLQALGGAPAGGYYGNDTLTYNQLTRATYPLWRNRTNG